MGIITCLFNYTDSLQPKSKVVVVVVVVVKIQCILRHLCCVIKAQPLTRLIDQITVSHLIFDKINSHPSSFNSLFFIYPSRHTLLIMVIKIIFLSFYIIHNMVNIIYISDSINKIHYYCKYLIFFLFSPILFYFIFVIIIQNSGIPSPLFPPFAVSYLPNLSSNPNLQFHCFPSFNHSLITFIFKIP